MGDLLNQNVSLSNGERIVAASFSMRNCLAECTFAMLGVERSPTSDCAVKARELGIRLRQLVKNNLFNSNFGWNDREIQTDNKFGLGRRQCNLARWIGIIATFCTDAHRPELLEATWSLNGGSLPEIFHRAENLQWDDNMINKIERYMGDFVKTINYFQTNITLATFGNYKKDGLLPTKIECAPLICEISRNNGLTEDRKEKYLKFYTLLAENSQMFQIYKLSIADGGSSLMHAGFCVSK